MTTYHPPSINYFVVPKKVGQSNVNCSRQRKKNENYVENICQGFEIHTTIVGSYLQCALLYNVTRLDSLLHTTALQSIY